VDGLLGGRIEVGANPTRDSVVGDLHGGLLGFGSDGEAHEAIATWAQTAETHVVGAVIAHERQLIERRESRVSLDDSMASGSTRRTATTSPEPSSPPRKRRQRASVSILDGADSRPDVKAEAAVRFARHARG
jgi:hypothetical protein